MSNITFIQGNAVTALMNKEINVLLHVTNCQHKMGSGIAKEIKERVPDAYTSYMKSTNKLGVVSRGDAHPSNDNISPFNWSVYNMNAQEFYGYDGKRYINYGALTSCLTRVRKYLSPQRDVIGIPFKMGCDRAGGDWEVVLELIGWCFKGYTVKIFKL